MLLISHLKMRSGGNESKENTSQTWQSILLEYCPIQSHIRKPVVSGVILRPIIKYMLAAEKSQNSSNHNFDP